MTRPHGSVSDDEVIVRGDARQRFHDARGYGRPATGDAISLSPVEAAHLLSRGDLESIDGMGFRSFFERCAGDGFGVRYLVYADLRDRGLYLSPKRWVSDPPTAADYVVYERGTGPAADRRAFSVLAIGEGDDVHLDSVPRGILAIVDEEGEITYLEVDDEEMEGSARPIEGVEVDGRLVDDRILVWDPPARLHRAGFYGQPIPTDDGESLQLSLLEAAELAGRGVLSIEGGTETIERRGRTVEGDRFDRRLAVYRGLRARGIVPKTGLKFGADFRAYSAIDSPDSLGHSAYLVRVQATGAPVSPRTLSLYVRLAHGVRKRMVFAIPEPKDGTEIRWRTVRRFTP